MQLRTALLLGALLAPLAAGQFGLAQISITAEGEGLTLDMGESAVVTFTVANEGTVTDLEVQVEVIELPSGWSATLDGSQFPLAPGEARRVNMTLVPTDQAQLGTASFTVSASGTYSFGPLGQEVEESTDTATVAARLRAAPTDATEWVPVWLIATLAAVAVAAIALGFWISRRGIRLTPAAGRLDAPAGTLAVLPVSIRNATGQSQRINLSLESDDPSWRPGIVPDAVQLAPGQEKELELQAIIPNEEEAHCKVTLRAESDSGRRGHTRVRFGVG